MTDVERRAFALLQMGFYQISIAHRMIARLPMGVGCGRHALYLAAIESGDTREHAQRWAFGMSEPHALDQFLRVYASSRSDMGVPLVQTLDRATFAAFKKLGGRSALG